MVPNRIKDSALAKWHFEIVEPGVAKTPGSKPVWRRQCQICKDWVVYVVAGKTKIWRCKTCMVRHHFKGGA